MVRATLNSKFELEELKPTNSLSEIHQLIDAISVEILSHFVIRDNHCAPPLLLRALAILRPAVGVPVFDGVG